MADRVRRTLPSVFPPLFLLYTHASTIGGYSSLCPPPPLHPRWDLREHWMESFSSHMTLSPRCVFRRCWATRSAHRVPLFLQRSDTKATFEGCTAKRSQWNTRHNKWACCARVCVCVCDDCPDRETRHWPLVIEARGPDKAAQLWPTDAPNSLFFTLCTLRWSRKNSTL